MTRARRKFGKRYYSYHNSYLRSDKARVESVAKGIRQRSGSARIVKTNTGYELWVRY